MQFKGRSLYNLLKISAQEELSPQGIEPWQVLDYRSLSEDALFQGLADLGIPLSKNSFLLYAENVDSPEDLAECLWIQEEDFVGQEKCYLFLFELWRRFLASRQSLSIFCDELDHLIGEFDQGCEIEEEEGQKLLSSLEDILHSSVDQGIEPKEAFDAITEYVAHDLEGFLYDYAVELLEVGSDALVESLLQAFEDYVQEKKWFNFIRARLFAASGVDAWDSIIHRILEEESDFFFLMEIASFLASKQDSVLFFQSIHKLCGLVKTPQDLEEIVNQLVEFHSVTGQDALVKQMQDVRNVAKVEEHVLEHLGYLNGIKL